MNLQVSPQEAGGHSTDGHAVARGFRLRVVIGLVGLDDGSQKSRAWGGVMPRGLGFALAIGLEEFSGSGLRVLTFIYAVSSSFWFFGTSQLV